MISTDLDLRTCNIVHIVIDSLPFKSAQDAAMLQLGAIGPLRAAMSLAPYTPTAHAAMWLGHLPSTITEPHWPFYHEPTQQLWRVVTGPSRDAGKGCGDLLTGNNLISSLRDRGLFVFGVGGVSQFSEGSWLRTAFPWSEFRYFGPNLDEELAQARPREHFPLNHQDQILERLRREEQWYFFMNTPEAHYFYDSGSGFPPRIGQEQLCLLKQSLNLRATQQAPEKLEQLLEYAEDFRQLQLQSMGVVAAKLDRLFSELRSISRRPTYVVICGDHGENFGERFMGRPHFGHLLATPEVMRVPLWIGML